MSIFGPDWKKEQERIDAIRAEKAEQVKREIDINVEDYKNTGNAQIHAQIQAMNVSKDKEIFLMNEETKEQSKATRDSIFVQKLGLATEEANFKARVSKAHEIQRKELEEEHRAAAKEETMRNERLKIKQDETADAISKIRITSMENEIEQTRKAEECENRLADEQKKLNHNQQEEVCKAIKNDTEARLAELREVNDKKEEIHKQNMKLIAANKSKESDMLKKSLSVSLLTYRCNELKAVNTEITSLNSSAERILDLSMETVAVITEEMNESTKKEALYLIDFVVEKLSPFSKKLVVLERKSLNIPDRRNRETKIEQVKNIMKLIPQVKGVVSGLKRELGRSRTEVNVTYRDEFENLIKEIYETVTEIRQTEVDDEALTEMIASNGISGSGQGPNAIEN